MKRFILLAALVAGCGDAEGGTAEITASLSCDGAQDARIQGTWTAQDGSTWDFGATHLHISASGYQPRDGLWCSGGDTLKMVAFDDLTTHAWDFAFDGEALVIAKTYRLTK